VVDISALTLLVG